MRWSTSTAGCVLFALGPIAAYAADAVTLQGSSVEILIDQRTAPGQWIVTEPGAANGAGATGRLGDDVAVLLGPGRVARFAVVNAVPALLDYSLTLKDPVPTENFKVAVSFLEKLAPLGGDQPKGDQAKGEIAPVSSCEVVYADVKLCAIRDRTTALLQFRDDASKALAAAIDGDVSQVDAMKRTLRDTAKELQTLKRDLSKVAAANLAASLVPASATWSIPVPDGSGNGPLSELEEAVRTRLTSAKLLLRAVVVILQHQADIEADIKYAVDFTEAYQQTFEKRYLGEAGKPVVYDPANDRPAEVLVTTNMRFADVFPAGANAYQAARSGTYKTAIKPRERLSLKFGAGVLYSFVRDPQFSVAEDDGGQLTIAKTEDDYAKFDGAVVLNITGADWQMFGVHPFFQLGVAPTSDKLAILAGGGLQLFDKGAISLGAIYQRVHRLAPGLAEGDVIDDPEALKTEREFKTGFYLMLSINLK